MDNNGYRYLELLKKCLTDYIYDPTSKRIVGTDWPSRAHTMIGLKRLDNLQFCIEKILNDKIEGDLIETGVWRGGATIFMRGVLKAHESLKKVFVADSFAGLPKPNPSKYPKDKKDLHYTFKELVVSCKRVKKNFKMYDLLDEQVVFIKGLFSESLPLAPINKLSLLRLDGDMYESTWDSLVNLYFKLEKGGFVIVDDFNLPNCVDAVTDFRKLNNIHDKIEEIDCCGIFWQKS